MSRTTPWLVDPYKGKDVNKTYINENTIHGFYIKNFDKTNSLKFTLKDMTIILEPSQQSLLSFKIPLDAVQITNINGCEFMCGGIE